MKYFTINRRILFSLALLGAQISFAQNISVINPIQNFGTTDENTRVDQVIKIFNPNAHGIEISGVESFKVYGSEPFLLTDTNIFLFPGDTVDLNIGFLPAHNVAHDLPLIVRTSTGFGHVSTKLTGQGEYSKVYYQSTEDKEGTALRTALKARISSGYNSLGYTTARDNMYGTIDNVNGDVECVYTGRTATFNTRSGANANSFNTEHTFPQGFFSQNEPMRSDIHHLFPTDVSSNSQRGNDAFGVVSNPSWSQGGSKSGGGKFEPRDIHKGASARAMMYFVLRYQDYNSFFQGHQALLYLWHNTYTPASVEIKRNNDIAALQNNRNPFVDYPQLMDRMRALVGAGDLLPVYDFYYSDDTIQLARGNTGLSTYSFLVYNNGDMPIRLFNWQVSDPSISFSPFQNDTVNLQPGDLLEIQLNFDAGISYQNELLSFSNDDQGGMNFQVPIFSDASFGESEEVEPRYSVFPNPADDFLYIDGLIDTINEVELMDVWGRRVAIPYYGGRLDIRILSPGIYFLQLDKTQKSIKLMIR